MPGARPRPLRSARRSTSATCTAQSVRPSSPNSRVPSSGSTIQTREADEPHRVVGALLGQHRVVGVRRRQRRHDEVVRRPVARGLDLGGVGAGGVHGGAQRHEELARLGGDGGGVAVVGGGGSHGGDASPAVLDGDRSSGDGGETGGVDDRRDRVCRVPGSRRPPTSPCSSCSCSSVGAATTRTPGSPASSGSGGRSRLGSWSAGWSVGLGRAPLAWGRATVAWLLTVVVGMTLRIAVQGRDVQGRVHDRDPGVRRCGDVRLACRGPLRRARRRVPNVA